MVFTSRIQNEDLDNIISELAPIEELFSSLEISEEADFSAEKSEEGVMMFGGGSTVSINEEQFNKLKSIVVREKKAEMIANGLGNPHNLYIRNRG